jgi:hypothetical protein
VCSLNTTHTETRAVVALGHDYQNWTQTTAPTCTTIGKEEAPCTRDSNHEKGIRDIAIDPDVHDWNTAYTTVTAETETTDGIEAITCKRDNSHTKEPRTLYATGTAGLEFYAGWDSYIVNKGTVESGAVHIPAYWRGNSTNYADYRPVKELFSAGFQNTSITAVTFAEGSQLEGISSSAFSRCASLTSITIPASVTHIDDYAFMYCASLASITIPASVMNISNNNVFYGCTSLASITVDANNPRYTNQDGIVYNKEKTELILVPQRISGHITIPDSVWLIPDQVFVDCTSLTSVTIPASVISIGNGAFYNCSSITSITIPASVTTISSSAFSRCTSLTSITIPASVTSISNGAFSGCTVLASITVDSNNPNYSNEGGILYNKAKTEIIAYPAASGTVTIPTNVTTIGIQAFGLNTSLTSVTIPESVTSIGNYAFSDCTEITSITIPATIMSVGDRAFYSWTASQTIYIKGHASEAAADSDWGYSEQQMEGLPIIIQSGWRADCNAVIKYWNGSSYQ